MNLCHKAAVLGLLLGSNLAMAESGWYISGQIGFQQGNGEASHEGTNAANTPKYDIENGVVGGIAVGYDLEGLWRFEGELRRRKLETDTSTQNGLGSRADDTFNVDATSTTTTLMANVFYEFQNNRHWQPYLKAGIGFAQHDIEATLNGVFPSFGGFSLNNWRYPDNDDTQFAAAIGAGISYALTPNASLSLDYQYIDLGNVETGTDANGDRIKMDFSSHEVTAGIRYRF